MADKLMLIDGNSIINRAFYGVPDLTNRDGQHTNAIYGFLNILYKLIDDEKPTHILIAFDEKAPTFRHEKYAEYKGNRKGMPDELAEQMPVLKELLQKMQLKIYSEAGVEADDIIGTLSKEGVTSGMSVTVVSGDRDLLQLVNDDVTVLHPRTKSGKTEMIVYDKAAVIRDFMVTPSQIRDLKGLMGDSSDNIPGVPGIGEKTAVKLLDVYGTVEEVLKHADEIENKRAKNNIQAHPELAVLSKDLATIRCDLKLKIKPNQCMVGDIWNHDAFSEIEKLEFKSILKRFEHGTDDNNELFKELVVSDSVYDLKSFLDSFTDKDVLAIRPVMKEKGMTVSEGGQMMLFSEDESQGMVGIAIATSEDRAGFFMIGDKLGEADVIGLISDWVGAGHILIGNDIKSYLDIFPYLDHKNSFDTNIAAYVVRPIDKSFAEEDIAMAYLGISIGSYEGIFGKKSYMDALKDDRDDFVRYMAGCALVNAKAYLFFKDELKRIKSDKLFYEIEMPLIFVLHSMEQYGILIERDELKAYGDRLGERILELEKDIYENAGEEFNINSPKQLGVILFEKKRLPYGKKTKTGYSTSAEVLEKLRLEDPIVDMILEYRQLTKLKSTYADGLAAFIDDDGRIRTTFNQNITATGRLSSSDPNLQNIPVRAELGREIRNIFVPEDGYVFLDADYSQIELRVLAHMSGDERLIDAYKQDADIHRITASQVFGTPFDEVTDAQRRNAKAVNFGIVYGISGFGLSKDLDITQKQAKKYIEDYFSTYPGVHSFIESLVEEGKKKGYVTSMFGRRRQIPELKSGNFMQRQFGERVAMNSPIQGTAADIIKIAMIRVSDRLKKEGLRSRLILQIHDELLVETAVEEIDRVKKLLNEEMVNACKLKVPLIADVGQGMSWGEAH
ncbi:MAG: DNA polymerase I [Eubacterium sp.]|nr:DNA polymerase I [Eubacterium sp.]